MVKAEIELPDNLYHRAQDAAIERACSFADLVCRGLEKEVGIPTSDVVEKKRWEPPTPQDRGWVDLDPEELKRLAQEG